MEQQNLWAAELDREIAARGARIGELQNELELRLTWIRDLETQIAGASIEIDRLNADSAEQTRKAVAEIARLTAEADELQAAVAERTLWAQRLDAQMTQYREELQRIASTAWFRAGAKLGLGPRAHEIR
jgi:fumarylacetoacetate (FAA) hydrolase family protein